MNKLKLLFICFLFLAGCDSPPWNNPHVEDKSDKMIYYSSFTERPKTLDIARSYSSNEAQFTGQIYEPPLQYHLLKRPYTLEPLTTVEMPSVTFLDREGNTLPQNSDPKKIDKTIYEIKIKPGILYQPHPAFAKDESGEFVYHQLNDKDLGNIYTLSDFDKQGARELKADDYVYQIKRLAHPRLSSPIFGLMADNILGMEEYAKALQMLSNDFIDLRKYNFEGAKVIDDYTYQITIKGIYSQFLYWLAMPFFAPIPWEADVFYSQPGMKEKNITFDWYPIGTGPFMLTENNPNRQMVLEKNPHFRGETYPSEGEEGDEAAGFLIDAGKPIPFIDKAIFSLEKEDIPRWNKFLQGYYDVSGIASDNFDQAVNAGNGSNVELTDEMKERGIRLTTSVTPGVFYDGFNMLDPVVGGYSEKAKTLRQAISIAINYEEYIEIFMNGRGIAAQDPLPPGIFGYQTGEEAVNKHVYEWDGSKPRRRSIEYAKQLLAEAGYPEGRDIETGEPLVLNYDVTSGGGPDDKARFDWRRKQFAKLGIQLNIRSTTYNRFQEKVRTGKAQLFSWGWLADYPDPENFLFLLYGKNGKLNYGGENAVNYENKEFDRLFDQMENMPNGPERQAIIDQMLEILQSDSPWIWGFHPMAFALSHSWVRDAKPNQMSNNSLKYARGDPSKRLEYQRERNNPVVWPFGLLLILGLAGIAPVVLRYWQKEHTVKKMKKKERRLVR